MNKPKLFVIALCTVFTAVLATIDGRTATIYACFCAGAYICLEQAFEQSPRQQRANARRARRNERRKIARRWA